jgi:3-deoxy-D-manno-octulosonate 8-phosphate phosphatase (KDO 8-P phosphatase)
VTAYLANLPADLLARAANIRLAAFDVDGTLTDGRLHYGEDGRETKVFHVHDGLGLKRLQANGIHVAIITARISHTVPLRAEGWASRTFIRPERQARLPARPADALNLAPTRPLHRR